jgi:rhamnosyltransferase
MSYKVACIVPTFNAGTNLIFLINSLRMQEGIFDIFFVDSSSKDGTKKLAIDNQIEVISIPANEFNHGGTRQMMVDGHPDYDIYVFLTQDAYLCDRDAILKLITPFYDPSVGAVCGRQLPHDGSSLLAQHARRFNYPEGSRTKSIEDIAELGIKVAFMSNSFAAYRKKALLDVGGFPVNVIFAEDMYVAAKMLMVGWKLGYAAEARCQHSHEYTIWEEFSRYFDMGVFHAREPWIREVFGGAGGEGLKFVKSELIFLGLRRIYLWPSSLVRNAIKLLGFKFGLNESKLSIELKRALGMHKRYWDTLS